MNDAATAGDPAPSDMPAQSRPPRVVLGRCRPSPFGARTRERRCRGERLRSVRHADPIPPRLTLYRVVADHRRSGREPANDAVVAGNPGPSDMPTQSRPPTLLRVVADHRGSGRQPVTGDAAASDPGPSDMPIQSRLPHGVQGRCRPLPFGGRTREQRCRVPARLPPSTPSQHDTTPCGVLAGAAARPGRRAEGSCAVLHSGCPARRCRAKVAARRT